MSQNNNLLSQTRPPRAAAAHSPAEQPLESPAALHPAASGLSSILLLGLLTWLLVSVTYSGAVSRSSGITGMDFTAFYNAGARLNQGLPLYQPNLAVRDQHVLYCYSPLPAELLRPLSRLPFEKALHLWFFINAGCLLLAIAFYGLAARLRLHNAWLLGILLLVSFRFWDNTLNFGLGQSNDLLLGLIGGMIWAESRGRWGLLGALIVLAALFKLWLIGLLLYPLMRRQWKPVLCSVVGLVLAEVLLFSLVGRSEFPAFLRVLKEAKVAQEGQEVQSSLIGFANVHLHSNPFTTPLVDNQGIYVAFIALGAAAVVGGLLYLWNRLRRPSALEARLAFGILLTSLLLLLPTYENGYFIYCFPLLWTLLVSPDAEGRQTRSPLQTSRLMFGAGVVLYLIFSRPWPFYTPFAPELQHGLHSLLVSMKFFGTAALWLTGLLVLRRLRRAEIIH